MKMGYMYQAELYCGSCGLKRCEGKVNTGDSDDYPQAVDVTSEADSPQYCNGCGIFLKNGLTDDGLAYVQDIANNYIAGGEGKDINGTVEQWIAFYNL